MLLIKVTVQDMSMLATNALITVHDRCTSNIYEFNLSTNKAHYYITNDTRQRNYLNITINRHIDGAKKGSSILPKKEN
jgi:hypothetical protein